MSQPLMPHATASWLVDNTALTFEQIADFCGLHILEVQAIADDAAATKLTGRDPVRAGELAVAEIEKAQADPDYRMRMRSEEHTSELQSLMRISYDVFCLKKTNDTHIPR